MESGDDIREKLRK